MTLTPEIDRGISIQCCCSAENSQRIFFELRCSVDELRSCYVDVLEKIQTSKLTDQFAYEATKRILGLDRQEAIGNFI